MTTFPDLADHEAWAAETSGATLTLPIRGQDYTFTAASLTMRTGIIIKNARDRLAALTTRAAAGEDVDGALFLSLEEQATATDDLVGAEAHAQMMADGVRLSEYAHVGLTLIHWMMFGEAAAREYWSGSPAGAEEEDALPPDSRSMTTAGSSTPHRNRPRRSRGRRSASGGRTSRQTSTPPTE